MYCSASLQKLVSGTLLRRTSASCGLWVVLFCLVSGSNLNAAETFSGHIAVGGRTVNVDGDNSKYRQHVNLGDGAQLFDIGILFEPDTKGSGAPDAIEFSASGIGNSPYQAFRIGVRKYGSYRFTYERQESEYVYEDVLIDPTDEDSNASNGGDFHRFDFDRVRDHVSLDLQFNDRAKLLLGFDQYAKTGDSTTVLDISREEFELEQPIDQTLKNYEIGFEYRWDVAALTMNQRWREFDNAVEVFLFRPSEGSDLTGATRLDSFLLEQPYGYDSQETQLGLILRPNEHWIVQADLLYADLDLDGSSLEAARGLDFLGAPLQTDLSGGSDSARTIRQLFLSMGYAISDRIRLTANIRDQNLEQDGRLNRDSTEGLSNWRIDSTSVALGLETIIADDWTLSAGWTNEERTTDYDESFDGIGRNVDEETGSDGYYFILAYRSGRRLTLNVSAEDNRIDDPFTFSAPTDSRRYRLRTGYKWDMGLKLNAAFAWRKHENGLTGWEATSEQTNLRLSYNADPVTVSYGTAFVDFDRSIDQLVTAGSRQVLFPIDYQASSDFWDGQARWHVAEKVDVTASYRQYDSDGSFEVKRDDTRLRVDVGLPGNYNLSSTYRRISYTEPFESFDADIWELSIGLRW